MKIFKTPLAINLSSVKVKFASISPVLLLIAANTMVHAQMNQFSGVNKNYVISNTVQVPGITSSGQVDALPIDENSQTVQYFDGLGRPVQTVITQGSPLKKDIVQPVVYDPYGREVNKYLPYVSTDNNGHMKTNPVGTTSYAGSPHQLFYSNGAADKVADDANPYGVTVFEPSPLNRVSKVYAPGYDWQTGADHSVRQFYQLNAASEVLKWTYTTASDAYSTAMVNGSSSFDPNVLFKNITQDEHGNRVIEYIDKQGRTLLKRVQAVPGNPAVNDVNYASTYYIYDDLNQLICVLPPEATKRLSAEFTGQSTENKNTFLGKWAFRYNYDQRGRMTFKQVPGAKPVYMIYDKRDRLVMTQDGKQRELSTNEWTFTKYDALNRPVLTGILADNTGPVTMQTNANSASTLYETYTSSGSIFGYSNNSFPQVSNTSQYLTVTYYDKYDSNIVPSSTYEPVNQGLPGEVTGNLNTVLGLVTGTLVKNLTTGSWLRTVSYYDNKYRSIQSVSDHQKGIVRTSNVYDFTGKVLFSQRKYTVNSQNTTVKETFVYDHAGRLMVTMHSVNGGPEVAIAGNYYNELGQLVSKGLHDADFPTIDPAIGQSGVIHAADITRSAYNSSETTLIATNRVRLLPGFHVSAGSVFRARIGFTPSEAVEAAAGNFKQMVDYEYNIRGWLTKINNPSVPGNDYFNMELKYNNPTANGGTGQFNGNISEAIWKSTGLDKQSYGYSYDVMNRLLKGQYHNLANTAKNGRFNEEVGISTLSLPAYDLNGNILNLQRYGKTGTTSFGEMDRLVYTYANGGNKLTAVADAMTTNANEGGFKEIETASDYLYDDNGNMKKDENKGVTSIEYNYLNLPSKVSKSASEYIIYSYDATGRKLSQQVFGTSAKTTDYIGELVLEDNAIQFISHSEGRVVLDGGTDYQYFLKDHLGNVRVTFGGNTSSDEFKASLEDNTIDYEFYAFRNYPTSGSRSALNMFDHTDAGSAATYSQLLTGAANYQVGLAKSFEVNSGDVFDLEVFAKYESQQGSGTNISGILTSLISVFSLPASGGTGLESQQARSAFTNIYDNGIFVGDETPYESGAPKAFLNYVLFNEAFQLVDFGFDQIDADADQNGEHDQLSLHVNVQQKGYLYVFLSNENPVVQNVYFDDLKIVRYTDIHQVEDYYPFGLSFNAYQRENSVPQDYLYNGKEKQDELDLGWLDYGLRMYQPDLGRWNAVDPLAETYVNINPYAYVANNPIVLKDPNGAEIWLSYTVRNEDDEEVTTRVRYSEGKLWNEDGKEYKESGATADVFNLVKDQLNSIKELAGDNEEIKEIFSTLEGTSNDHDIDIDLRPYNPDGKTPEERNENRNKLNHPFLSMFGFDGTTTNYNPLNDTEPENGEKRDPRIALIHELRHAYDREIDTYEWTSGGRSTKTGKYVPVSTFEFSAVNTENVLRLRLYGERRTTYMGVKIPSQYLTNK